MSAEKAATTPATGAGAPAASRLDADRFKFGVLIRAKFIGVEDVKQDTGDDICQTSMVKLKAVVLAKKEHKPRICIRINLEGVEILDEKTNDSLYKHSVNRISYIARDVNDARAIGYIYKTDNNEYQYYAIKTIGQAQELFNALKDLFEVVLEMRTKKKSDSISQVAPEAQEQTTATKASVSEEAKLASQLSTETADLQQKIKQMNDQQQNLLDVDQPPAAPSEAKAGGGGNIFDDLEQISISTPAPAPAPAQEMKNELLDIFSSAPVASTPPQQQQSFGGATGNMFTSQPTSPFGMGSSPPFGNMSPMAGQPPRLPPMPPQMGSPQLPPMPGHFMGAQPAFAGFPAPGQPNYNVNISNPFGSMQQQPAMFNQFQQQQQPPAQPPKPNISANFPFN